MDTEPVFLVQIETKPDLIGQADLFCYSVNKFYPDYKIIIISNSAVPINRPNTEIKIIQNTIYPKLQQKYTNKFFVGIKRVTFIKEFLSAYKDILNNKFCIITDPDVTFIGRSKFLDSFNGLTRSIFGVGPFYSVPANMINLVKHKTGGNEFKLYSCPFGIHGSNIEEFINQWLDIWSYYMNDNELFPSLDELNKKYMDHGNGYLLEMIPPTIVAKNMKLEIVSMFNSYYTELYHYFHPLKSHIDESKYPTKQWSKREINWSKEKIQPINFVSNPRIISNDLKFYRIFNEWVENYKNGGIIQQ